MTKPIRLLDQFRPKHYAVELDMDSVNLKFSGHVAITGEFMSDSNQLTLHASDLDIDQALVADQTATVKIVDDNQTIILSFEKELTGEQKVELTFNGKVGANMHGLYYSDYKEDGEQKRIISTQLESHHAREVFPCIDEPAAKAVFELTTISDLPTISNTPQAELGEVDNDRIRTKFKPTPTMSTYLLALVSGELGQLESTTNRGTVMRVFSPPRDVKHLEFALDTAVKCLEFYEEYFGVEYPLEKCDMVAIPEFAAGAMENWGLITYRETSLLVDEQNSSIANKQYVAHVIAHELAHQWFGNLVTMKWWDDLWLNEGFASWIENLVVDDVFPDWGVWTDFAANDLQTGLAVDALDSSHAIVQPVEDPSEINEIFDLVTYRKGPSVIRMLHDYMGADAFRTGISQYIKKFAHQNAVTADLWHSLSAVTKLDVAGFMDSWINKRGFPLVSVGNGEITQRHFLPHPKKTASHTVWQVPVHDGQQKTLLSSAADQFPKKLPLTINPGNSSFIRVSYPTDHYSRLAKVITTDELTATDKVGLISDVFAVAMTDKSETTNGLELIKHMQQEPSEHVWETIGAELAGVRTNLLGDKHQHLMAPLVEQLIAEQYQRLGWKPAADEPESDMTIRSVVIALALRYELFDAPEVAAKHWEDLNENNQPVIPDLRSGVYAYAARSGLASYDELLEHYNKQTLNEERLRFARAITAIEDVAAANRSLELIKTESVRQQDVISWLAGLMLNPHTRQATWDWYRQDWDWLYEQFNQGHIYSLLANILAFFNTDDRVEEIIDFFSDKDTAGLAVTLSQSIEQIEIKSAWIAQDEQPVKQWLKQNYN